MRRSEAERSPGRRSTLKWFRAGKTYGALTGFVVTWDVDSRDRAACRRLQRFIYGDIGLWNGRVYRYPGFIHREGVRYLGQSVLLVRKEHLSDLVSGLTEISVDFEVDEGSIG